MPFGRSKDKDRDEDEKRSALFGGRSKSSKSSNPQSNPYANAAPPADDPYAARSQDAYSSSSRQQQSQYDSRNGGGGGSSGGYGSNGNNYGQASGYGRDAYGSQSQSQSGGYDRGYGGSGGGGYGGMSRQEDDSDRSALFGDAAARQQQQRSAGGSGAYGGESTFGGYGSSSAGYGDRELTAEEQEAEDVQAAKNEIRYIKQQDIASTRNARRIAEQAEATGRETLARLGQQGERIFNAERNLDMASTQNRIAQDRASELKTLNRSMFAVHVGNPFTKGKREAEANQYALDKHREDKLRSDATRDEQIRDKSRQAQTERGMSGLAAQMGGKKNLAERSKYQFEADSEDEEMENEIDENLDVIHRSARTLNALGKAMESELDSQNRHIQRIIGKTDMVDDEIALNRARLDRIR